MFAVLTGGIGWMFAPFGLGSGVIHPFAKVSRQPAAGCHETFAVGGGEMTPSPKPNSLPHHRLVAYQVAFELATLVGKLRITDARLREQARKSAASSALNIAEGAGRRSLADKRRVYAIALAECCEAAAAVEIAGALRACSESDVRAVVTLASRLARLLNGLLG